MNTIDNNYEVVQNSLVSIGSELFRFKRVFDKAISKLEEDDRTKYTSQFAWFAKKVYKALEDADLKLISLEGEVYDPGMAITPLNIDDFEAEDKLYVEQTIEPIVMHNNAVIKTGTVILGRIE